MSMTIVGIARLNISIFLVLMASPLVLMAQRTVTRSDAVRLALSASARGLVAASDTTAAAARLRSARAYPNPTLSVGYSKAVPQTHASLDLPLDLPSIRRARIRAASDARTGAHYTFLAARAALALDVDTLYVRAQVLLARRDASAGTAHDGAQLLALAEARRAAGDAADLDVELARINATQAASAAAGDSADAVDALLEWHAAMGLPADSIRYIPTAMELSIDSINTLSPSVVAPQIAAAEAAVTSAHAAVQLQRASRFGTPALQLGFDAHDPTERGLLPIVGIALPLPLFNHNGGEIAAAQADLQRAQAELTLARVEVMAQLRRAQAARAAALARVQHDSETVASANRIIALSQTAYREGEMTIADVLQAQRTYRDVIVQYQNDWLSLFTNDAVIRVLTGRPVDTR